MADSDQLPIPDAAKKDPRSFELLRVWVANNGQHVSLRSGVWKDPAAWGIMLADLAKHVANSYQQDLAFDRALHAADESLGGWQLHEIHPVKFGGEPFDIANKMPLPAGAHNEVTNWWNSLQRALEGPP